MEDALFYDDVDEPNVVDYVQDNLNVRRKLISGKEHDLHNSSRPL